ncbi:MAG TPA: NAD(P)-binding protein, partial [Solirubrobacterales bacterium]|nr:NAD(P)-binding protein [Solirubrobacterales bacterium]
MGVNEGQTRRQFMRASAGAGAAALAATSPLARIAGASGKPREVAILGGGMAGLAAAHEAVERGFKVTVYEPVRLGGKARSIPVPGTKTPGRRPLPGEHGFRFFPGFYHHVPDTMRRIPYKRNANGVHDNLVDTSEGLSVRANGEPDALFLGLAYAPNELLTVEGLRHVLVNDFVQGEGISPAELEYFANRLLVFVTSSDERRFGQWENVTWWDFVGAEERSEEYKKIIARGLTRSLVAAKEQVASTRTIGNMGEAFVMNIMQRGNDGALDRVLDAPTNEAWINPWVRHLEGLGVKFELGQAAVGLDVKNGQIRSATVADEKGRRRRVDADWFFLAMPAERARKLWSRDVLAVDPSLKAMDELFVDWMVGIQYFLRERVDLTHGHITFVDAPWALTALTQAQMWGERDFPADYGDGEAVDCLSLDISDWDSPGILYNKPAKECTPEEISAEVWAQVKAHLEDRGDVWLPDGIQHSWFI